MLNREELVEKMLCDLDKYSPVLITGASGAGKTHTLRALLAALSDGAVKICSGDSICNSLIEAVKNDERNQWREELLSCSVLLIDDIDFLEGREYSEEELMQILKKHPGPVVATSKSALREEGFSPELVSYFAGGAHLHLELPTPDEQREYIEFQPPVATEEFWDKASLYMLETTMGETGFGAFWCDCMHEDIVFDIPVASIALGSF